jgi:serine/threonine protein kinase
MYKERSITSSVDIDELICKECNEICIAKRFQQNFKNWTSGNNDIDKIIQDSQLSDHYETKKALEWIPYDRFHNIKYIAKGGFGKVYKANWIDGPIDKWSKKHNNWIRKNNKDVALKKLNNSKKFSLEFMSEV